MDTPRAYSYLRFSTPDQMRGDSYRRQSALAQSYAERNGLQLDEQLTFQDLGVSAFRGRNASVGKLGEFKEAVESGLVPKGSFLLVESLDRISRNKARRALRVLEDLCELGITVVTLSDGRAYTEDSLDNDPTSLLMSVLIFMRANEESATKSHRLKAVWQHKRAMASDKPITERCPAWLRLDKKAGTFIVLEDRAEIVRRIFKMTLDGRGQNLIAETFNQEGIPVFGRGRHWHRSYVAKLLKSPPVVGTLVPHVIEYEEGRKVRKPLAPIPDYYPAVVDRDTYERVQALKLDNKVAPLRGRHANGEVRNVFGGLSKCPQCGGSMTRVNKGRRKGGKPYLVCTTAKAGAGCQYKAVSYDTLEATLRERAKQITLDLPAGTPLDDELDQVAAKIDGHTTALDTLIDALSDIGSSPTVAAKIKAEEAALAELRTRREDLIVRRAATAGKLVQRRLEDLKEAMDIPEDVEVNRQQVNTLLRQLFSEVTVDYPNGRLVFEWQHGGSTELQYGWPDQGRGRAA